MTTLSVFSSDDMRRVCTRISHEIIERNNGANNLVLIGLIRRGALLANRLAKQISEIEGEHVPAFSIDIAGARDDRSGSTDQDRIAELTPAFPQVLQADSDFDFSQSHVVLVDDVLYTGRSIRAAMDIVTRISRPERIQLAVLVDRGHRELPIRADFIGKNLPTKRAERVNVLMDELDGIDRVDVERMVP